MAFTDSGDDAAPGGPPDIAPGGPGGGGPGRSPPSGGGPILAALAQRRAGPPVSAPGPGNAADSLMMLKQAVDLLNAALPGLGSGSKPYQAVLGALKGLTRFLPQGAPTAGVQQTQLMDLLRGTVRNALMQKLMQQGQGPGGGAGGGGAAGGAPMPSMPMPGA